jgi:hypothetical protein
MLTVIQLNVLCKVVSIYLLGIQAVLLAVLRSHSEFKDNRGRTPLSRAARNWRKAVVKLLLENGAGEL